MQILNAKDSLEQELCAAAAAGDYVLVQLLIDCGASVATARLRRRGAVQIAMQRIMVILPPLPRL